MSVALPFACYFQITNLCLPIRVGPHWEAMKIPVYVVIGIKYQCRRGGGGVKIERETCF